MDLQLPLISGIEASQTIRKLESIKKKKYYNEPLTDDEKTLVKEYPMSKGEENFDESSVKVKLASSFIPCIIVALTASNTLEDKNMAIKSGCNDYLTKPVNLVWLSNKLMEWGYMQSLMTS